MVLLHEKVFCCGSSLTRFGAALRTKSLKLLHIWFGLPGIWQSPFPLPLLLISLTICQTHFDLFSLLIMRLLYCMNRASVRSLLYLRFFVLYASVYPSSNLLRTRRRSSSCLHVSISGEVLYVRHARQF